MDASFPANDRAAPLATTRMIGALGLSLLAVFGCAARQALPSQTTGDIRPSDGRLWAKDLVELRALSVDLVDVDPKDGTIGTRLTRSRTPTTEHGATWLEAEGDRRIEYWRGDGTGGLAITASLERSDDVVALFDPPLVLLPPALEVAVPFASESTMRIVSAANPDSQRESGTARRTVTWVGDEWIEIAAGRFNCHRIEIDFIADLHLVNAETRTIQWHSPGVGLVAEERSRQVTILGIRGSATLERWERAIGADSVGASH